MTALLAAASVVNFMWKPAPPEKFLGLSSAQVPMSFGVYRGEALPVDPDTKAALPTADIIEREYTGPSGESINATIIGGVGREQLHDPRSCLVGAGWQIANDHVETLIAATGPVQVRSCQATIGGVNTVTDTGESQNTDIMYLYVVNRRVVASASSIRVNLLISDLLEQNDQPVYYIRTLMEAPDESAGAAAKEDEHQSLGAFTAALWSELSPTIYQGEKQ